MTSRRLSVLLMLLALPWAALAGCHADPATAWSMQRDALTATQDTILELHAAGVLEDQALLVADPAIQAARAALASAAEQLPDGPDLAAYLRAARHATLAAAAAAEAGP